MLRATIRWRLGKYRCRVLSLISSAGIILAYYILSEHPIDRHRPVVLVIPADFTSHKAPAAGLPHISGVSKHVKVIKQLLFTNSTCASNHSQSIRCSGCLRPRASKVKLRYIPDKPAYSVNKTKYVQTVPGVVQNLITDYLITPILDCPYLLAVQASLKNRPNERDVVRRTWGSVAETQIWPNRSINANMKILFVVANMNNTEKEKQENHTLQFEDILSEARIHNDILYINMNDSYRNLTLKILSAFKWVKDNCPCTKFVLKVDFDTFVNVPLLIDILIYHEDQIQFSLLGFVYRADVPVRRYGKWAVPRSLYPMDSYPQYASGCGYVLSIKAVSQIVETAPHVPIISVEDVFITGVLRYVIGLQMINLRHTFTHFGDKTWLQCELFNDTKALGMNKHGLKHQEIWESFFKSSCSNGYSPTVS